MTWQNALFVVAGVALMGLLEWVRHRYEDWRRRRNDWRRRRTQ
jgi:hypothetical protein